MSELKRAKLTKQAGTGHADDLAEHEWETFAEFQQAMIKYAKEVQGEHYVGDAYYLQDDEWTWRPAFEDGDTAEEAVDSDMSYWEP